MRIVLLTHEFAPYPGGIATYCYNMAKTAGELGYDITVSGPNYGDRNAHEDAEFNFHGFDGGNYRLGLLGRIILRTHRVLRENDFDVAHAIDLPHAIALQFLNRTFDGLTLATCHGSEFNMKLHRFFQKYTPWKPYGGMDRILSISEFSAQLFKSHYPAYRENNLAVVPHGVSEELRKCANPQEIQLFREKYRIPDDKFILLALGRIDRRKGHLAALEVLSRLPARIKQHFCYVIVGKAVDRELLSKLEARAKNTGVEIIFTGPIGDSEVKSALYASDIFFLPCQPDHATKEGFGLVFVEASACGLPVISCEVDAIPEVVQNNENGFVYAFDDFEGMKDGLIALFENSDLRNRMAEKARDMSRRFTWENCVRSSYEPLAELVSRRI